MADVNAADIITELRLETGDLKRDAATARQVLMDLKRDAGASQGDLNRYLRSDPTLRGGIGRSAGSAVTSHHGGLDPVAASATRARDAVGSLNSRLTDTDKILKQFGTTRGRGSFLEGIARLGPNAIAALAAVRALSIGLQAASDAADLYYANQSGNIERQIAAQKKFGDRLRSIPLVGELGGAIRDLVDAPERDALARLEEENEKREKRLDVQERRINQRTAANRQARDMARDVGREIDIANTPERDRDEKRARNRLADLRREIQETWENTGGMGPAKLTADQVDAVKAAEQQITEARKRGSRIAYDEAVGHNERMIALDEQAAESRLRTIHETRQAEREALRNRLAEQARATQVEISKAREGNDPDLVRRLKERQVKEAQVGNQLLADHDRRAAEELAREIADIQSGSQQTFLRATLREHEAAAEAIRRTYARALETETDPGKRRALEGARDTELLAVEISRRREIAATYEAAESQRRQNALRAARQDYAADTEAFNAAWDAKMKKIRDAGELQAAVEQRAAEEQARAVARNRETDDIIFGARMQNLRNRNMSELAEVEEMRRQIADEFAAATGDPRRQAAIRDAGIARVEAFIKGRRSEAFMGDAVERARMVQMAILQRDERGWRAGQDAAGRLRGDLKRGEGQFDPDAAAKNLSDAATNLNKAATNMNTTLNNLQVVGVIRR